MKIYKVKESGDVNWQVIQANSPKEAAESVYGEVWLYAVKPWFDKQCYNFSDYDDRHMYWVIEK